MFKPKNRRARPDVHSTGARPYQDEAIQHPVSALVSPHPDAADPTVGWTVEDLETRFLSFADAARYIDGQSPDTVASYRVAFANFRRFLLGRVGAGTPLGHALFAIEEWVGWNRRQGRSRDVTLHSYWRKLRSFFRHLERRSGVQNPFRGLRPPRLGDRIPKAIAPAECRRVLDTAANYPWRSAFDRTRAVSMLGCALFAGLRRGEILKLQCNDVDLRLGTIQVHDGKGIGDGKGRVVPMAPDLALALRAYHRQRELHKITAPEFFCSTQRQRGVSLATFRRIAARVRRGSGVPFSLHALRHSFVTQLLRSGIPIHTVSALAGHSQISTTAGYLRVFDADKTEAVRKLRFNS